MEGTKLHGAEVTCLARLALPAVAYFAFATEALAGATGPILTMTAGTGLPGTNVTATLSLSGGDNEAVSAAVDVLYESDIVDLQFSDCRIDPRIGDTHQLGGRVIDGSPNSRLVLDVFVAGTPQILPPLDAGNLVTCDFAILPGVPAGTTILRLTDPLVANDQGAPIAGVQLANGEILVQQPATPTPTPTEEPAVTPTATGATCNGDCDLDGEVMLWEVVTGISIGHGRRPLDDCRSLDLSGEGEVDIAELVRCVVNLLDGCS